MRVSPIFSAKARNFNSPGIKQNFGWFDKHDTEQADKEEQAIVDLMPPLRDDQRSLLRNHPAVIIKRDGDRVYGELNKDYKNAEVFKLLDGGNIPDERLRKMMNVLDRLEIWKNFNSFWNSFTRCVHNETYPEGDKPIDSSSLPKPAWDVDLLKETNFRN